MFQRYSRIWKLENRSRLQGLQFHLSSNHVTWQKNFNKMLFNSSGIFIDRRLQTELSDPKQITCFRLLLFDNCVKLLLFNKCAKFIAIRSVWPVCSCTLVECIDILGQNIFNLIDFYRFWRNIRNLTAHEFGTAMSWVSKVILPQEKLFAGRCI